MTDMTERVQETVARQVEAMRRASPRFDVLDCETALQLADTAEALAARLAEVEAERDHAWQMVGIADSASIKAAAENLQAKLDLKAAEAKITQMATAWGADAVKVEELRAEVARLRAPEVLAADETVQAMMGAVYEAAANRLLDLVAERKTSGKNAGNDYIAACARKVASLTPADAASALARLLAEAENRGIERAAVWIESVPQVLHERQEIASALRKLKGATP